MSGERRNAGCARKAAFAVAICISATAFAQTPPGVKRPIPRFAGEGVNATYLRGTQPTTPEAVAPLGTDLFGDKINLYTGSFEIEQTDTELPGNNALRVALVRQHTPGRYVSVRGPLGDWDINTPRIGGTFASLEGWVPTLGSANTRWAARSRSARARTHEW